MEAIDRGSTPEVDNERARRVAEAECPAQGRIPFPTLAP
jgi:hypothetical protein